MRIVIHRKHGGMKSLKASLASQLGKDADPDKAQEEN